MVVFEALNGKIAKTAEQTLRSLCESALGRSSGRRLFRLGGCADVSATSEKVSKDDPEENVRSFFFCPLEMGGVRESSLAGCFDLAKHCRRIMGSKGKTVALGQNGHVVEMWNFSFSFRAPAHTLKGFSKVHEPER